MKKSALKPIVRVSLPHELGSGHITLQVELTDTLKTVIGATLVKAEKRGGPAIASGLKYDYRLKLHDGEDEEYLPEMCTIKEVGGIKARKLELLLERVELDDEDLPAPPPEESVAVEVDIPPPVDPMPPRISSLKRPAASVVAEKSKEPTKETKKESPADAGKADVSTEKPRVLPPDALVCARCNNLIESMHYKLGDALYHKQCFSCSQCGKNLSDEPVSHREGKIFCETDFLELYGEHCGSCGEAIRDRILIALDTKWHTHCFKCCLCMKPLEGTPFFVEDRNVYCERDYKEQFATRCHHCKRIIDGQYVHVQALDQKFHPQCLVCCVCNTGLCGRKFFCDDNDDEIYCAQHYEKHAVRCAKCNLFITSAVVHAEDKHFHEACYRTTIPPPPAPEEEPPVAPFRLVVSGEPPTSPRAGSNQVSFQQDSSNTVKNKAKDVELEKLWTEKQPKNQPEKEKSPDPTSRDKEGKEGKEGKGPEKRWDREMSAREVKPKVRDEKRGSRMFGLGKKDKDVDKEEKPRGATNRLPKSVSEPSGAGHGVTQGDHSEDDSSDDEKSFIGKGKEKAVGYVKYKDMVDGSTLAPFIKHGVFHCLKAKDYHLFRPDYRKKDLYHLELNGLMFQFQDYAPRVFFALRAMYGIGLESYVHSLVTQGLGGGKLGAGKSGMLFYFSVDRKFVLKSTTRAELKFFRKILREYYSHMRCNPHSLLPRFFGLYKITMPDHKPLRLVVMNNIFLTELHISEKFDLKGSTRNRYVDVEKEKESSGGVLKDLNYHDKMYVGPEARKALKQQMERDTAFLVEMDIMDQSLLLGVHRSAPNDPPITADMALTCAALSEPLLPLSPLEPKKDLHSCFQHAHGGIPGFSKGPQAAPNGDVYFLAIIDILQMFDMKKRVESTYKGMLYNKKAISAVSSRRYADRFLEYMDARIE